MALLAALKRDQAEFDRLMTGLRPLLDGHGTLRAFRMGYTVPPPGKRRDAERSTRCSGGAGVPPVRCPLRSSRPSAAARGRVRSDLLSARDPTRRSHRDEVLLAAR